MATNMTWLNRGIDDREKVYLGIIGEFSLRVRLYVNNHAPVVTDTNASYTECTAGGYAPITLLSGSWVGSTVGGVATYTYPTLTITFTDNGGGQTIYGAYVDDLAAPTPHPQMAGLLDTPYVIPAGGGTITIDLTDTQKQCP